MSELDTTMEENMVCATVHAHHAATATTIRAYLAAHRPDRILSFKISTPSADMGDWCERLLADAGVSIRRTSPMLIGGTASGQVWSKLLVEQGELMDRHSIQLSPARPGNTS